MNERRDIVLPVSDVMYLDAAHPGWVAIRAGAASWVVLPEFAVPDGYDHSVVTAALRLEPGYPDTQIDMVFFNPLLARADGNKVGATGGRKTIDGATFQQWSRHRTQKNPWRPGVDDIESHMLLVRHWLERELS